MRCQTLRIGIACLFVLATGCPAQLAVDNLQSGEVLQQHAVLIRGRSNLDVTITADNGLGQGTWPAVDGRFLAVVDLPVGKRRFRLQAGDASLDLALEHRASTNPYRLKVVYLTAADGRTDYLTGRANDPQDYRAKLDTAAKLLQAFTAEAMHQAGHGRLTFQLETDAKGTVTVHTRKHPASRQALQRLVDLPLYSAMHQAVERHFDLSHDKLMVIAAFSGYDAQQRLAKAHLALGGGAVGTFSNLFLHVWPDRLADTPRAFTDATAVDTSKVFEDVGLPDHYHLAATTLGAVLHEMGHTFGLPHTSDPRCIMARGFDNLHQSFVAGAPGSQGLVPHPPDTAPYWSPAFALRLAHSPWFSAPTSPEAGAPPSHTVSDSGQRVLVSLPAGLAGYSVHCGGNEPVRAVVPTVPTPAPRELRVDFDTLRNQHHLDGPLSVFVYDRAHRLLQLEEKQLRNTDGYLRTWWIGKGEAWDRKPPATPTARTLDTWRKHLPKLPYEYRPASSSPFLSIDLLEALRGTTEASVVLRGKVASRTAGPGEILAGGDDGLRVWVNGTLALSRPELGVFAPDSLRVPVEWRVGENEILVQSFQGGGGWGLSLRAIGPDGKPLPECR